MGVIDDEEPFDTLFFVYLYLGVSNVTSIRSGIRDTICIVGRPFSHVNLKGGEYAISSYYYIIYDTFVSNNNCIKKIIGKEPIGVGSFFYIQFLKYIIPPLHFGVKNYFLS